MNAAIQKALAVTFACFYVATICWSAGQPQETAVDAATADPRDGRAQFDSKNQLLLPKDYREWVFVGSSLGLSYSTAVEPADETFMHVYINPFSYREFRKTGTFPHGTMFLLEIARKGTQQNPALQGTFAQQFVGLEAAVKSGERCDEPWTYFSFDAPGGQRLSAAPRLENAGCIACHREHGETDHVFTQFYPVLKR